VPENEVIDLWRDDYKNIKVDFIQEENAVDFETILERFILNNGNRKVGKQELCRIMKISRPTLNKWISADLISEGFSKKCSSIQTFDLQKVASELENM
jgi:hypothetical protein